MDTFNPNQMPPIQDNPEKKSIGPLISVIIILVLIIVGGLYFLKTRSERNVYIPNTEEGADSVVESLKQQEESDELDSIEADLLNTDLDNLDQDAAAIEAELE
ncbi:MAG: hypothetical protein JW740_00515 [Candidatus Zambryskibacteria bacterium]|nr:hypothetical protein [Candidatus Zambryskibacteria bacterium]